ncbi:pentapeptide repeat-containing protein [uncultured Rothia sp.]|uniref:pentapeptide repeat-containing protein n=1 Tax=uncultured Rothia sp. TaxID=316088 RepID=UPI002618AF97|nr:pentapeptide repeat-containing protein [uncultured Rothia sp.]
MPTASDSEQTTQPGRQSNSKASNTWLKIREILNNKWVLLIMIIIIWTPYFATGHEWNSPNVHWLPISLMLTIIFVTILFLWKKVWFLKNISQFNSWIFGVTIIGGTIAFLLPLAIADNFSSNGEGTALRQMLIYTTGGLLGVITLSETRRKNDLEKSKFTEQQDQFRKQLEAQKANLESQLDAQKKTLSSQLEAQKENLNSQLDAQKKTLSSQLEAQKENLESQLKAQHDNLELQLTSQEKKDKRDHSREVHAERRSRYTKAVEQLAHEKSAVRLGGIYTLVGLVDEWLEDEALTNEEQLKEGQTIINNLCSYIRSPFLTAEKIEAYEARNDFNQLEEYEAASSFEEYSPQLRAQYERFKESGSFKNFQDITADYAKFHEEQDVRRTIFVEMSKRSSTFTKNEKEEIVPSPSTWSNFEFDFSRAPIFYPLNDLTIEKGNFSSSKFHTKADFSRVTFTCNANFSGTIFTNDANFIDATFINNADFNKSIFIGEAKFIGATHFINAKDFSRVTFSGNADFNNAEFHSKANFTGADFAHEANFNNATFTGDAIFRDVIFTGEAKFGGATFTSNANFVEATFKSSVGFYKATFTKFKPTFIVTCLHARFSAAMNPRDYNFSVTEESKPIRCGTAKLLGKSFRIPLSTILFDPDSNDISEPAKPIDKFDNQGETPSK